MNKNDFTGRPAWPKISRDACICIGRKGNFVLNPNLLVSCSCHEPRRRESCWRDAPVNLFVCRNWPDCHEGGVAHPQTQHLMIWWCPDIGLTYIHVFIFIGKEISCWIWISHFHASLTEWRVAAVTRGTHDYRAILIPDTLQTQILEKSYLQTEPKTTTEYEDFLLFIKKCQQTISSNEKIPCIQSWPSSYMTPPAAAIWDEYVVFWVIFGVPPPPDTILGHILERKKSLMSRHGCRSDKCPV